MAKRSFQVPTFTPTATADTTGYSAGTFMGIGASGATAGLNIVEVMMGGQATASNVMIMMLARDSTIAVTPTALSGPNSDGPMNTMTAALAAVPLTFVAASTEPQRSALTTAARLNFSFNAFGGLVRWQAAPGEEWGIVGITASVSESSLSGYTGSASAAIGAHIIYEPF